LLNDDELSKSNLLTVTLDSMYALPETWAANLNKEYAYTAAIPLPVSDDVNNFALFVIVYVNKTNDFCWL
jgi:hypothetical protein